MLATTTGLSYNQCQQNGNYKRLEERAIQRCTTFITDQDLDPVKLYFQLVSSEILSYDIKQTELERMSEARYKAIQIFEILKQVIKIISENPVKFSDLCSAFEELELPECSTRLKGDMIHHAIFLNSKLRKFR